MKLLKELKKAKSKIEKMIDLVQELGQAKKYTKELKENKERLSHINEAIKKEKSKPQYTAEVKKALEVIKGAKKAEFKGILEATAALEKQVGDLKLKASGKSKNEGNIKIELDAKSLLLLNGLKILMEAGFMSTNDFSVSAEIEEELGKLKAKVQSGLKGLAQAQGKLRATGTVLDIRKGVLLNVLIKAEAGFKLNLTGMVKGELSLEDKLKVTASITGEINIEGNAVAEGEVKLTIKAVSVRAKAGAKAKAEATAKAIVGAFAFKDILGVELEGGVKGEAKAEASAQGEFTVDLEKGTIAIGGKVTALAKVGAKVYSSANFLLKGQRVVSVGGNVGVSAGYGGEAGGAFQVKDGKLLINVDLGAAIKGGGQGEVTIEIDLKSIATIIKTAVQEKYNEWSDIKVKDGKVYIKLENDEFDTPIDKDAEGKALREAIYKQAKSVAKIIKNYRLVEKNKDKVKDKKKAIGLLNKKIDKAIENVGKHQSHFTAKRLEQDKKASKMVDKELSKSLTKLINKIDEGNKRKEVTVVVKNQKIIALDGWNLTDNNDILY